MVHHAHTHAQRSVGVGLRVAGGRGVGVVGHPLEGLWGSGEGAGGKTVLSVKGQAVGHVLLVLLLHRRVGGPRGGVWRRRRNMGMVMRVSMGPRVEGHLTVGPRVRQTVALQVRQVGEGGGAHGGPAGGLQGV